MTSAGPEHEGDHDALPRISRGSNVTRIRVIRPSCMWLQFAVGGRSQSVMLAG